MGAGRTNLNDSRHADNLPAWFLWLLDVTVIVLAFVAAYWLAPVWQRRLVPGGVLDQTLASVGISTARLGEFPSLGRFAPLLFVVLPATLVSIDVLRGYAPLLAQTRTRVALVAIGGPTAGAAAATLLLFATGDVSTSRLFLFTFVLLASAGLFATRQGLRSYKVSRFVAGHYQRNVVLVGSAARVASVAAHFRRQVPHYAYRVVGVLTPDPVAESPDIKRLGAPSDLGELLIHQQINDIVAVQSLDHADWLTEVIDRCDYLRVPLHIVPEALLGAQLRDLRIPRSGDVMALPAITLRPEETDGSQQFIKRLFDLVVASLALLVLSPLFLIIAVLIKWTTPSLPVFYRWNVVGYKGRRFTGYKFTTMQADADDRKDELAHLNEMGGPVFKIRNDPRMTSLGKWLRKFSLNELPQLWSVVRGDMSLVGPRPAFPHELGKYEYWQKRKLSVRPGITCLWQVSGRNAIADFDEWVRLDLEYIDNWSLWLDVKILVWTVGAVVRGTGS